MKKTKLTAMVLTLLLMAVSVTGCGDESGTHSSVSANKKTEKPAAEATGFVADCMDEASGVAAVLTGGAVTEDETDEAAELTEAPKETAVETADAQAETDAATSEPKADTAGEPKADNVVSNNSTPNKAKSGSSGSGSSGSGGSGSSGSGGSTPSTPAPTQAPHTHTWKEHVATEQVWVPNIVVVGDYEEQLIYKGFVECSCGYHIDYEGELGAGPGIVHDTCMAMEDEHIFPNITEAAHTQSPCACGYYTLAESCEVVNVKVGSHEEDHGHYETNTYVDYWYCDCGATKQ